MSATTFERKTPPPWMPDQADAIPSNATQGKADLKPGTVDELPPEAIFSPEFNYTPADISEQAGIPIEVIQQASVNREISDTCTTARDGHSKCWKGNKVAAWIRRSQTTINPPASVRRQIQSYLLGLEATATKAKAAQAQAEKDKTEREGFYRDAAERSPALVDVLVVLDRMAREKATPADILKLLGR